MSHGINDNAYKVLTSVSYYDVIKKQKFTLLQDDLVGSVVASQIILPEVSIQDDIANSKLTDQEYIDLVVSLGYVEVAS